MIIRKITAISPPAGKQSLAAHRGYAVRFFNADGSPHYSGVRRFYGLGDRTVFAEATAYADLVKSQLGKKTRRR